MRRYALLAFLTMAACQRGPLVSIRDPNVYANELDYNNMVQSQAVQYLQFWLKVNCKCSDGEWTGPYADACDKTAKHILVVETRQGYHTHLAEYNGNLREDRPDLEPPSVPESHTLCPEG